MSNLRAGVQILIDQMASNPDEFFGPLDNNYNLRIGARNGKFAGWRSIIENELLPDVRAGVEKPPRSQTWFLSDEEKTALADAYTEACKTRFDAEIVAALMAKPEDPRQYREAMRVSAGGTLSIGAAQTEYVIRGAENGR